MATETVAYKMGDHEAWRAEYNGHEILIVNKGRTRLIIDGEEMAVQKGRLPIATKLNLIGEIKGTGELVIATLNGSMKNEYRGGRTEVHIYVGRELTGDYGFVDPQQSFTKVDDVHKVQEYIKEKEKKPRKISIRRKKKMK
ncbi:MAG: hypothetical protein II168_09305 [Ruminococcus sp.]|nr:hypothetical protein [Ruminococcus sp.]